MISHDNMYNTTPDNETAATTDKHMAMFINRGHMMESHPTTRQGEGMQVSAHPIDDRTTIADTTDLTWYGSILGKVRVLERLGN